MLFEILAAVGGYYAYRHLAKGSKFRPSKRSFDAIGAAGEATDQAKHRKTLYWLCGNDFYLHEGPLAIEHAPGTQFPIAEIDHLAVTPFGVFIFETKNGSVHIAPSTANGYHTHRRGRTCRRRTFPEPSTPQGPLSPCPVATDLAGDRSGPIRIRGRGP